MDGRRVLDLLIYVTGGTRLGEGAEACPRISETPRGQFDRQHTHCRPDDFLIGHDTLRWLAPMRAASLMISPDTFDFLWSCAAISKAAGCPGSNAVEVSPHAFPLAPVTARSRLPLRKGRRVRTARPIHTACCPRTRRGPQGEGAGRGGRRRLRLG